MSVKVNGIMSGVALWYQCDKTLNQHILNYIDFLFF